MTTTATRPADARTILRQIGTATLAEIGARQVVDLGDGVHFTVKTTARYITKVRVRLAANDTYLVETLRIDRREYDVVTLTESTDVYAESLSVVIRAALGMV